jgi:hypothetical protein
MQTRMGGTEVEIVKRGEGREGNAVRRDGREDMLDWMDCWMERMPMLRSASMGMLCVGWMEELMSQTNKHNKKRWNVSFDIPVTLSELSDRVFPHLVDKMR